MTPGQRVRYWSAVNPGVQHCVIAVVDAVNPDGSVDVSFPDRPGVKLGVPISDHFPEVEIRGQRLLRSFVEEIAECN